jgi:N-acetylglucosamine-6-phosphate deacetylase
MKTPLLIEEHFHGAFGVDWNKVNKISDIQYVSHELLKHGIGGFFPTLVTDSVANIKRQIEIIKAAAKVCPSILGIHLEGIFINPEKKGIHNPEHFLELTVDNYRLLEDDFIKIVTLAPELDKGLIDYLHTKEIKVHAGHCTGGDLSKVDGVTHLYNAMSGVTHRGQSTALSGLVNDNLYTEIIADGIHVSDEALRLVFKSKPADKIILISDSLPITHSDLKETVFADSKIYYDGERARAKDGTIAGSTLLLDEIIKILGSKNMFKPEYIENTYRYHNLEPFGEIEWDDEWRGVKG